MILERIPPQSINKLNKTTKPKKLQKYKTSGYLVANSNSEAQPVTVISDDAEII